jgi:hypothetical protein
MTGDETGFADIVCGCRTVGATTMAERSEMVISNLSGETVWIGLCCNIAMAATLVAALNLFFRVEYVASCIWLAFMAWIIWGTCMDQGGLRQWLIWFVGVYVPIHFVESTQQGAEVTQLRLGYRLFGIRLFYFAVPLQKIETVQ